jgi:hypothetical protein
VQSPVKSVNRGDLLAPNRALLLGNSENYGPDCLVTSNFYGNNEASEGWELMNPSTLLRKGRAPGFVVAEKKIA